MVVIVTIFDEKKEKRKFIAAEVNNRVGNIVGFNDDVIEHYVKLASDSCESNFNNVTITVLTKRGITDIFCNISENGDMVKDISPTLFKPFSILMQIGYDGYVIDGKNKENILKEVIVSVMADCVEFITYKDGKPFKKTVESFLE